MAFCSTKNQNRWAATNEETHNQGSPSAHRLAILRNHPRLTVTPSQLNTIALLRGSSDPRHDPVCRALYVGQERENFQTPLPFPYVSDDHDLAEFQKGTVVFWDPLDDTPMPPQGPIPSRSLTYSSTLGYQEFLRQYPPRIGSNHARANDVWDNFGYIKVNGTWVDPESTEETNSALKAHSAEFGEVEERQNLHGQDLSEPKIFSPDEADEFYKHYTDYVSDEIDGEGDPRHSRISPQTFCRWAVGASRSNTYFEESLPQQQKQQRQHSISTRISPDRTIKEMQFDIETGSTLSPLLDLEDCPSVLESALGVDVTKEPDLFSFSCPQSSINTRLRAYRNRNGSVSTTNSTVASDATTFETFRSRRARKDFIVPADPQQSSAEWNQIEELRSLREMGQKATWDHIESATRAMQAVRDIEQLKKERVFLKLRIEFHESQAHMHFMKQRPVQDAESRYRSFGGFQANYAVSPGPKTQQPQTCDPEQNQLSSCRATHLCGQVNHHQKEPSKHYCHIQSESSQIGPTRQPQTQLHHSIRPQSQHSRIQTCQNAQPPAPKNSGQHFQIQADSTKAGQPQGTYDAMQQARRASIQDYYMNENTDSDDCCGKYGYSRGKSYWSSPLSTPTVSKPPKSRGAHRNQYQRYIDEDTENQKALLWENEQGILYDKKNQERFDAEIADLTREKEFLLMRLGVQHISQVPHLFPPKREHRPRVSLVARLYPVN